MFSFLYRPNFLFIYSWLFVFISGVYSVFSFYVVQFLCPSVIICKLLTFLVCTHWFRFHVVRNFCPPLQIIWLSFCIFFSLTKIYHLESISVHYLLESLCTLSQKHCKYSYYEWKNLSLGVHYPTLKMYLAPLRSLRYLSFWFTKNYLKAILLMLIIISYFFNVDSYQPFL